MLRSLEDPVFGGLEEDADSLIYASASGSSTPTLKSSKLGVVGVPSPKASPERSAPSCGARREREFSAVLRKQAIHGFGLQVPGCTAPCSPERAVVAFGNKAARWERVLGSAPEQVQSEGDHRGAEALLERRKGYRRRHIGPAFRETPNPWTDAQRTPEPERDRD